jgi:hypothetical protein
MLSARTLVRCPAVLELAALLITAADTRLNRPSSTRANVLASETMDASSKATRR